MSRVSLKELQELFGRGVNIIEYLQKQGVDRNTAVEMSYDLQAGTYIQDMTTVYAEYIDKYSKEIADLIGGLGVEAGSLMEAGVGEATTLSNVVKRLEKRPSGISGFDISWSRIRYAKQYYEKTAGGKASLFIGDLFQIPYSDDSIDVVYTSHSIEPNGGREAEALVELHRVAAKYLILFEPSYEMATEEGKAHIDRHGYVKGLPKVAKSLGFKVIDYHLANVCARPSNPTAVIVIEKDPKAPAHPHPELVCPVGRGRLRRVDGGYWSESALVLYPELDGIPCLTPRNGIIATHYSDFHAD
ncbi:MAG TPA: class I SAM-dependent methyltransferase [Candidatus Ozemobacteraceae bacterium]|nr:class I SAM-dependent methyltransferase [Candidatus Ozemobacteraceae bacterium]